MEIFSARLKWLREKKGLTQKEMAEMLSLSQQYYGRFEKNKGQPNLETLAKLPSILGESLDFFLGVTNATKEVKILYERLKVYEDSMDFATDTVRQIQEGTLLQDLSQEQIENSLDNYRMNLRIYAEKISETRRQIENLESEIPI